MPSNVSLIPTAPALITVHINYRPAANIGLFEINFSTVCIIVRNKNVHLKFFWLKLSKSRQSQCHHVIYHILWAAQLGGSVKIMSLRVVVKIITMRAATDRRWVRTKQTETRIMETNDPEWP